MVAGSGMGAMSMASTKWLATSGSMFSAGFFAVMVLPFPMKRRNFNTRRAEDGCLQDLPASRNHQRTFFSVLACLPLADVGLWPLPVLCHPGGAAPPDLLASMAFWASVSLDLIPPEAVVSGVWLSEGLAVMCGLLEGVKS